MNAPHPSRRTQATDQAEPGPEIVFLAVTGMSTAAPSGIEGPVKRGGEERR
jgi:hypothetical protein